jgi:hypothetical protein
MRILLIQPDAPAAVGFRTMALPEPLHLEMIACVQATGLGLRVPLWP